MVVAVPHLVALVCVPLLFDNPFSGFNFLVYWFWLIPGKGADCF